MIIIVNENNIVFRISDIQHIYDNQYTNLYGNITKLKITEYNDSLDYLFNNLPPTIKNLTIKQCNILTFPNINPEIEINSIDLSLNRIVHLPNFQSFIHLKNLSLHSNLITDISEFPPNIERLDLSNNKIVSIESFPNTLHYFNISSNLILFRPQFLDIATDVELVYNNNIFNIIPNNNHEENLIPLIPEQNILFSEAFNLLSNNDNEGNNSNNNVTPFSFSIEYEILENNNDFLDIELEEIIINNPYKDITEKMNNYLRNNETENINIPNEFFCPISKEIMLDPVVIRDGYTYEKKTINEWFKYSNKSPITSKIVKSNFFINNTSLRNMIREWIDKNKNLIE